MRDGSKKEKSIINKYIFSISIIIITGIVNILGYFHLPDKMAMQFTAGGLSDNRFPTPIYLTASFAIVLIISLLCIQETVKEQKIKWMLCDIVISILNIVMIVLQLS